VEPMPQFVAEGTEKNSEGGKHPEVPESGDGLVSLPGREAVGTEEPGAFRDSTAMMTLLEGMRLQLIQGCR